MEKPNKVINLYLFSEMDEDTGDVVPVQLELSPPEFNCLIQDVRAKLDIIQFGRFFHHKDDIIKFVLITE